MLDTEVLADGIQTETCLYTSFVFLALNVEPQKTQMQKYSEYLLLRNTGAQSGAAQLQLTTRPVKYCFTRGRHGGRERGGWDLVSTGLIPK